MAGSYHAGSATVDIVPSMLGFHAKIKKELAAATPNVTVGVTPDTKKFQAGMKAATAKTPTVKIGVEVNKAALAKAKAEITAAEKAMASAKDADTDSTKRLDIAEKQLTETRAKKGVKDSQILQAELRLAQAKRASAAASNDARNADSALAAARAAGKDAQIKVDADASPAERTLRAFSLRAARAYATKIGVDADTTSARATVQAFAITAKRTASVTGNLSLDTGAALAKIAGVAAASSVLGAKWSAIGLAGGAAFAGIGAAAVALPALLSAAVGPAAALVVGFQGIGDALSAYKQQQEQATASAGSMAKAQQAAARQVASAAAQVAQAATARGRAVQDAGWAEVAADRQVMQAEKAVTAAKRVAQQAEEALTQSRREAAQAMEDLNFQVRGGLLSEREATLAVKDAKTALDQAMANGVSGDDLERVTVAYERQVLQLDEAKAKNKELSAEQQHSNQVGIEGSAQVVAAHEQVAQANQGVADAVDGVQQAETARYQQQVQSQRAIDDAALSERQAIDQLNQALQDAGNAGQSAGDKVAAAMAKLSPNAREFVTTLQALKPEFAAMKNQVQDALFSGMGPAFADLAHNILPAVGSNLSTVATAINGATKGMFGFLSTGPVVAGMQQLFAGIGQVITAAGPALQQFVTLFLQLANAGMPGLTAIVQALGSVAASIGAALAPLIADGTFNAALQALAAVVAALGPILGIVLGVAVQLMAALGPPLVAVVNALAPVLQLLGQILIQMAPFVATIVGLFAAALMPIMQALQPVIAALMPVIVQLVQGALMLLVPIIQVLSQILVALMPLFAAVVTVVMALIPPFLGLLPVITSMVTAFVPLVQMLIGAFAPVLVQVAGIISSVLNIAMGFLVQTIQALMPAVMGLLNALLPMVPIILQIAGSLLTSLMPILPLLANLFSTLVMALVPLIPPLLNLAATLFPVIIDMINALMPVIIILANILTGVLAIVLQTIIVPILNLLVNAIKIVIDVFNFLWQSCLKPVWDAIAAIISWVWDTIIKPIFDWIGQKTAEVGDAFKRMGDTIGGIWDGLKRLVHDGIQAVIDFVWNDGLRKVVNAVLKWVPGVDALPEFKLAAFATGGPVSGPGGPTSDMIPAMLSNGEFVVNADATGRWRALLESLNANRFATGGVVGGGSAAPVPAGAAPVAAPDGTTPVASLSFDPAMFDTLGAASTALQITLEALATSITTIVNVALQAMQLELQMLALTTTISLDQMAARWNLFVVQHAIAWQTMTLNTQNAGFLQGNAMWASVNSQNNALGALENGLGSARTAMTFTADWATQQFDRMKAAAADPVRWVIQWPFNAGIIAAWNKLDGDFALNKHVNPVPITFATGGAVRGPGTGTSDSINARLSDGEFVVREKIARQALPFLSALNAGNREALHATGGSRASVPRFAEGGPVAYEAALARGRAAAASMNGKPYVWGGASAAGADCSGYMSIITSALVGDSNWYHRRFTTAGLGDGRAYGFTPGLSSAFAIGNNPGTHMAGTLDGVNVESASTPIAYGGRAHGADDNQFPIKMSLPFVGGRFVSGGGGSGGGIDVQALVDSAFADTFRMVDDTNRFFPGNTMATQSGLIARQAADAVKNKAFGAVSTAVGGMPDFPFDGNVAATVMRVAKEMGMGRRGAEVGLVTGLQESGLRNLNYGDRDSLGVFQQRPSQGWGTPAQILNPVYAAGKFYDSLRKVAGWQTMSHGDAAQKVQRSAFPRAYDKWVPQAINMVNAAGLFDRGGLALGPGFLAKNTLEPERMLSPAETRSFDRLVAHITGTPGGYETAADVRGSDGVHLTQHITTLPHQDSGAVASDVSRRTVFALRNT